MKVGLIGSMQFTERMLDVREQLNSLGHEAFVTDLHTSFIGKNDDEKEEIKLHQKNNCDAIREFWRKMQGADAVLVLNYHKNGVENYIGGNTLMEIGFAHVLNQKIFLLNPIPEIPFYKTEIEAVKPIILNGDLSKIGKNYLNENKVKIGQYQHYKGNFYDVLNLGWHSDTMENYVVYQGLYDSAELGKNPIFVKNADVFCENIIVDGKEVPRFKFIEEKFDNRIDMSRVEVLFNFSKELEKLKYVERAIMVSGQERYENTAEHTWHMAMMILVFKEFYPNANMEKMLKLALIHDLVEIYAGDTPLFDAEGRKTKEERELKAAEKLFSLLPENLEKEFKGLFIEYEKQETSESKIAKCCDELQAVMQNVLSNGKAWKDNKLDSSWLVNLSRVKMGDNQTFQQLWDYLFKEIKERNLAWDHNSGS
ncbi:MAG: DUF1653 domain-containing protein [Candidatus Woesearchaeota archaeon]